MVDGNKIVAILDFERTDLGSIDYHLDLVQRMQDYPTKYINERDEHLVSGKDYCHLIEWFQLFYPQLFQFENLEKRLSLYSLYHNLDDYIGWPINEVRERIEKDINYKQEN